MLWAETIKEALRIAPALLAACINRRGEVMPDMEIGSGGYFVDFTQPYRTSLDGEYP